MRNDVGIQLDRIYSILLWVLGGYLLHHRPRQYEELLRCGSRYLEYVFQVLLIILTNIFSSRILVAYLDHSPTVGAQ